MSKNWFFTAILAATTAAPARSEVPTVPSPDVVFEAQVAKSFVDGLPDPRGLPYHAVTLKPRAERWDFSSEPQVTNARVFVLPGENLDAKRFGLAWDGAIYELESVGAVVDWRIEARELLATAPADVYTSRRGVADLTPQPVAETFLWRLGEPEMARALRRQFAESYLFRGQSAVKAWLQNLRATGIRSFGAGDFGTAERCFQTLQTRGENTEATRVLAEIARRRNDGARPVDEIEGLIWDLQNARASQFSIPGNISWTQSETVRHLIEAGDAAVPALLDAFANDERLTRSYRAARHGFGPADIAPVSDAARAALQEILHRHYYDVGSRLAPEAQRVAVEAQMRADWEKMRGFSPAERLYRTLADDAETPERWSEAARVLVGRGPTYDIWTRKASTVDAKPARIKPLTGESLRFRTQPSVTDLLAKRATQVSLDALHARRTNAPGSAYAPIGLANSLARAAAIWDLTRAVPLLQAQWAHNLEYESLGSHSRADMELAYNQVQILRLRMKAKREGNAPLQDYARWLEKSPFGFYPIEAYLPLVEFVDEAPIQASAARLFATSQKPFETVFTLKKGEWPDMSRFHALSSKLLKLPAFRALVARELQNTTVVAQLHATSTTHANVETLAGQGSLVSVTSTLALQKNSKTPLRVADLVGHYLREGEYRNQKSMLDLTLSPSERDKQLQIIRKRVIEGDIYSGDSPYPAPPL